MKSYSPVACNVPRGTLFKDHYFQTSVLIFKAGVKIQYCIIQFTTSNSQRERNDEMTAVMWLFRCNSSMSFPLLFLRAWFNSKLRIEAEKERFRFSIAAWPDPTSNTATTACKFNVRDWLGYVDCNLGRFHESALNFKCLSMAVNEIKRNPYWKGNTLHTFSPSVLLPVYCMEGLGLVLGPSRCDQNRNQLFLCVLKGMYKYFSHEGKIKLLLNIKGIRWVCSRIRP